MKTSKIVAVLAAGLLSFTSAFAGEITVTGGMQATYQSNSSTDTGNPLGLNTDLAFSGSTEVMGNAVTWTMGTDGTFLGDSGADHKLAITTAYGTFFTGNSDDAANNVDDITPSAFEEANGSGGGKYGAGAGASDFGSGMEGSMTLGYRNADLFGTGLSLSYNYYPKLDGKTNNEKGASGANDTAAKSAQSIAVATSLANVPGIGSTPLGGLKITAGYENSGQRNRGTEDKEGATVALNYAMGSVSLGYQKKAYQSANALGTKGFYKDDIYGIAFAVNESLAISLNRYESTEHNNDGVNDKQTTDAINLAYTVGGLTIGLQNSSTDNYDYSATAVSRDTKTISLKTAF
jgi:hypothetical protein